MDFSSLPFRFIISFICVQTICTIPLFFFFFSRKNQRSFEFQSHWSLRWQLFCELFLLKTPCHHKKYQRNLVLRKCGLAWQKPHWLILIIERVVYNHRMTNFKLFSIFSIYTMLWEWRKKLHTKGLWEQEAIMGKKDRAEEIAWKEREETRKR